MCRPRADETWTRRFGDCKGKTVLLIALLNELGIEAEPVLVSTVLGDGLDQRLPLLNNFDHVIVRAHVGTQWYWLSRTRLRSTAWCCRGCGRRRSAGACRCAR